MGRVEKTEHSSASSFRSREDMIYSVWNSSGEIGNVSFSGRFCAIFFGIFFAGLCTIKNTKAEDFHVHLSIPYQEYSYGQALVNGALEMGSMIDGINLTYDQDASHADLQKARILDAVTSGTANAIIVEPLDLESIEPIVEIALNAGIPVVTVGKEIDDPRILAM